jgi:hypothetical protein
MLKKLNKLYLDLQYAMNSNRIDEEFLQYIEYLQDEIQKLETQIEETKVAGQP